MVQIHRCEDNRMPILVCSIDAREGATFQAQASVGVFEAYLVSV